MRDVIALDQPFLPRKRQECRPNFPQNMVFQYTFQYTHVISWCLTSGEVQPAIHQVYTKNRYVIEDSSGKAADVFLRKIRDSLSACVMQRSAKVERIRHTNLTARLPRSAFYPHVVCQPILR